MAYTLAYYDRHLITTVKKFKALVPGEGASLVLKWKSKLTELIKKNHFKSNKRIISICLISLVEEAEVTSSGWQGTG